MRILGIGDYHSLGEMYRRLTLEGHEVRVFVSQPEAHGIFGGIVERCEDWRQELGWLRAAGGEGLIVCETAGFGAQQDMLRADGFQVIGGCAWGDRLENDRAYGQRVLREAGMRTAPTRAFSDFDRAIDFIRDHPRRYVYKVSDGEAASTCNYVGELEDGADVCALLQSEARRAAHQHIPARPFVLMPHLQGVEVGIGAYFNGERFLRTVCLDWEHKRFFPGDLGELTGEMGTVVTYRGAHPLFDASLGRMEASLREHGYVGYINLNTIVNEDGIWPLEFTCRFGYPGYAICDALHLDGWGAIFRRMIDRSESQFATRGGYSVGVVLTVPPFPYEHGYAELSKGAPVFFRRPLTDAERGQLYFGEVEQAGGRLRMTGSLGYVMVATGIGERIAEAQAGAYALAGNVVVPNLRYRKDIGDKLIRQDLESLRRLGY